MRPFNSPERQRSHIERESSSSPSLATKLKNFIKQKIAKTLEKPEPVLPTAEQMAKWWADELSMMGFLSGRKSPQELRDEYDRNVATFTWQYNLEGYPLATKKDAQADR